MDSVPPFQLRFQQIKQIFFLSLAILKQAADSSSPKLIHFSNLYWQTKFFVSTPTIRVNFHFHVHYNVPSFKDNKQCQCYTATLRSAYFWLRLWSWYYHDTAHVTLMRQVVSTGSLLVFLELLWFNFGRFVVGFDMTDKTSARLCRLSARRHGNVYTYVSLKKARPQDIQTDKENALISSFKHHICIPFPCLYRTLLLLQVDGDKYSDFQIFHLHFPPPLQKSKNMLCYGNWTLRGMPVDMSQKQ